MFIATVIARNKRNFNVFCSAVDLKILVAINMKTVMRENLILFNISGETEILLIF